MRSRRRAVQTRRRRRWACQPGRLPVCPGEMEPVARLTLLVCLAAGSVLVSGCGHAGDALDCQIQNHSADWFDGSQYRTCMDKEERWHRERAQHERDQEACRGGNFQACYEAGTRDLPVNERIARRELEAACGADIGGACWQVGLLVSGDFFSLDRASRALGLFLRACELREARGCAEVARMHPDEGRRADFAERACRMGAAASCAKAGDARLASDPGRARQLYELGCEARESEACVALDRQQRALPRGSRIEPRQRP